jgi:hypothetical protein
MMVCELRKIMDKPAFFLTSFKLFFLVAYAAFKANIGDKVRVAVVFRGAYVKEIADKPA